MFWVFLFSNLNLNVESCKGRKDLFPFVSPKTNIIKSSFNLIKEWGD